MEYSVGSVIFNHDTTTLQVLLIQQKNGLHIGFPKGHVEPNETIEDTARRETLEEVGLTITLTPHSQDITYTLPNGKDKKVTYFLAYAHTLHTTIQEEEIIWARFFFVEDAMTLLTYENDKHILQTFINIIKEDIS